MNIFRSWQTDIKVLGARGSETPSRELAGVLVTPASMEDEQGFTQAVKAQADLYLIRPSQQPPKATDRVEIPQSHPLRGLWQVEGEAEPWPLGIHIRLRRINERI